MTARLTGPGTDGSWAGYLDALEAAVSALDGQLLDGRVPAADTLEALAGLTPPASPVPDRLQDRRALLLAMLHDVTGRATGRRDAVAAELAALPHRRTPRRADAPATLGGTLDVTG